MAVLRGARGALLLATLGGVGACSLALDPGDLTAERADINGDIFPTDGDTGAVDTATASDTAAADTVAADTAVVDSVTADTVAQDTAVDTTPPGPDVVIKRSGASGCELDYHTVFLNLSDCPKTCPSGNGWSVVFDATDSTGVTSYSWSFSVTNEYKLEPKFSTDGRVELKLDVPSCDLFSGTSLGSARIYATLVVNGDGQEHASTLDFSVRYLSSCGSSQGACLPPP